jgi:hypothetical protein
MSAPPFERRPVTDPAEAKRVALASLAATRTSPRSRRSARAQRKAKPKVLLGAGGTEVEVETLIAPSKKLTPSAARYAANETAWARRLRRKADGRRSGRDQLDLARAKRARHRRSDAYIDGQDDTPLGAYTQLEVDALGARGEAFQKRDGSYGFVVKTRRDLLNALAAWRQLPSTSARARTEALEVKAWIKERAIHLKLEELLPANWQLKIPDTIGDSAQPDG